LAAYNYSTNIQYRVSKKTQKILSWMWAEWCKMCNSTISVNRINNRHYPT